MSIRAGVAAAAITALITMVGCADSTVPSTQQSAEDAGISLSVNSVAEAATEGTQPDSGEPVDPCPLSTAELDSIFEAAFQQYYENSLPCEFYSEIILGLPFRVNFVETNQSISSARDVARRRDDLSDPNFGVSKTEDFPEFGPGAFVRTYEPTDEYVGKDGSVREWSYVWPTPRGTAGLNVGRWEGDATPVPSNEVILTLARKLYGVTNG